MNRMNKNILYTGIAVLLFLITAAMLLRNANRILENRLQQVLGKGFAVEDISLKWCAVEAKNVSMIRADKQKVFSADTLALKAGFIGLLKGETIIKDLDIRDPFLLLEMDRKGNMLLPFPAVRHPAKTPQNKVETIREKGEKLFLIRNLRINNGALDYRDHKVSTPPAVLHLTNLNAEVKHLSIPPENASSEYTIQATVPGTAGNGSLKADGTINLRTKDTRSRLNIQNIDLVPLRPYYEKKGDVAVTRGLISVDAQIAVLNSKIHSAGKIIIKDLEFRSDSGSFLGLPAQAVLSLLKDGSNQIALDFSIEGDLNNPKFSIRDNLVQKLSLSLGKALGLPIEEIGKSIFELGGSALKRLFQ